MLRKMEKKYIKSVIRQNEKYQMKKIKEENTTGPKKDNWRKHEN